MKGYNYYEAVREDVMEYLADNIDLDDYCDENGEIDREQLENDLNDDLWIDDSVTGNASGSYTFSTWEAEENLCHNLDLLGEALVEFGCGADYLMEHGAEACDVTIRCFLLAGAIADALDEILG